MRNASAWLAVVLATCVSARSSAQDGVKNGEWRYYAGDSGSTN
jgi:hypothetical protein